jgi:hypothetical protein
MRSPFTHTRYRVSALIYRDTPSAESSSNSDLNSIQALRGAACRCQIHFAAHSRETGNVEVKGRGFIVVINHIAFRLPYLSNPPIRSYEKPCPWVKSRRRLGCGAGLYGPREGQTANGTDLSASRNVHALSITNSQQGISNRTSQRGTMPDVRPEKKRQTLSRPQTTTYHKQLISRTLQPKTPPQRNMPVPLRLLDGKIARGSGFSLVSSVKADTCVLATVARAGYSFWLVESVRA